MKTLPDAIEDYIGLRRSLGFKLKDAAIGLRDFAAFLEQKGATHITTNLARKWAMQKSHILPAVWAMRLSWVRVFARHWSATDPRTEVPPAGLLPFRPQRAHPYLYSDQEIQQLLDATQNLPSMNGLRPWTYRCLLGLLAVSGLRLGEVQRLACKDVDLKEGLLVIRQTKFNKTRLIPLHPSTQEALRAYAQRRDQLIEHPTSPCFFLNEYGRCLDKSAIHRTFYRLSRQIGIRGPTDHNGPRLHDFRQRFAVTTLIQWYRAGEDVQQRLPILSTYLGHAQTADTYWYLSIHPELMGLATARLEQRWENHHEPE